jgi:hypothetical protein
MQRVFGTLGRPKIDRNGLGSIDSGHFGPMGFQRELGPVCVPDREQFGLLHIAEDLRQQKSPLDMAGIKFKHRSSFLRWASSVNRCIFVGTDAPQGSRYWVGKKAKTGLV